HKDTQASETAQALNAKAFTIGQDVVFGEGEYSLGTSQGRKLLAHELTHVVQQSNAVHQKPAALNLIQLQPVDCGSRRITGIVDPN
ncbi:MAG: DUF4157 domain-containing protein, partial [Aliifodinibius sp.]|nr:DUF4157 domain-containing protein [Fodinibius sp.]NIV14679.1 DUF4157 domain-containing protein [Fodinibius sp.]NIY28575.1 DUF4157 domain-containing protein [Fodinibius sp.]